jgi:hypothetical protein
VRPRPTLKGMAIDTVLLLVSLVSFLALVAIWVAAPLHAEEPIADAEPAGNTVPA